MEQSTTQKRHKHAWLATQHPPKDVKVPNDNTHQLPLMNLSKCTKLPRCRNVAELLDDSSTLVSLLTELEDMSPLEEPVSLKGPCMPYKLLSGSELWPSLDGSSESRSSRSRADFTRYGKSISGKISKWIRSDWYEWMLKSLEFRVYFSMEEFILWIICYEVVSLCIIIYRMTIRFDLLCTIYVIENVYVCFIRKKVIEVIYLKKNENMESCSLHYILLMLKVIKLLYNISLFKKIFLRVRRMTKSF